MSKNTPNGYHVFELEWRGCWHWRKDGAEGMSRCYGSEQEAESGARADFERWAAALRAEVA